MLWHGVLHHGRNEGHGGLAGVIMTLDDHTQDKPHSKVVYILMTAVLSVAENELK